MEKEINKRPREIEFTFADFKTDKPYVYWECYAKELEEYINFLESKLNGKG